MGQLTHADAAVDQACRMLRPATMRARCGEVADAAQREQLTYRGFLAELLMAEWDDRDRRRSARPITAAERLRQKWLQDVDDAREPARPPAVVARLAHQRLRGQGRAAQPPRTWAERTDNITRHTRTTRGGHAAHEEPALLADDLEQCFAGLR